VTNNLSEIQWRFTIIETIGAAFSLATVAVAITLWSIATFQSRSEAQGEMQNTQSRLDRQQDNITRMQDKIDQIKDDVSFIRGKLESKQ